MGDGVPAWPLRVPPGSPWLIGFYQISRQEELVAGYGVCR